MSNFMKKEWNIVKHFKLFAAISLAIIVIGIAVLSFAGLNLGIEFAGGVELSVNFEDDNITQAQYEQTSKEVKDYLSSIGISAGEGQKISDGEIIDGVKFSYKNEINSQHVGDDVMNALFTMMDQGGSALSANEIELLKPYYSSGFDFTSIKSLNELNADIEITPSIYFVGSSVSAKLLQTSLIALIVALVLILAYIIVRFRSLGSDNSFVGGLKSGLAAIIGLVHDVLIMFSFVLVAGWLFDLQITSTFVAAVVTIVAYSINNTIVVFDRIRDNRKRYGNTKINEEIVNKSIKEVFIRSLFTSLTTIFAILILTILGVSTLREFTLPILVGLIAGTYSSLFIAPCLWNIFNKDPKDKKPKQVQE